MPVVSIFHGMTIMMFYEDQGEVRYCGLFRVIIEG